jgi:hypothetical protein
MATFGMFFPITDKVYLRNSPSLERNQKNSPRFSSQGVLRIQSELADYNYVGSLRTLGAFLNGEFDFLAFFKVFETVALDRGEVHENIRAAFTSKKAIALASVEPFDCSGNTF